MSPFSQKSTEMFFGHIGQYVLRGLRGPSGQLTQFVFIGSLCNPVALKAPCSLRSPGTGTTAS